MRYDHLKANKKMANATYAKGYEKWLDEPYKPVPHKKWTFYEFGDTEPKPKDNDDTFGVIQ